MTNRATYFVPYMGDKPAAVHINGHRLLILAKDIHPFEEGLHYLGADSVRGVRVGASQAEEAKALTKLSRKAKAELVIAPSDLQLAEVIRNLESQLPWIQ